MTCSGLGTRVYGIMKRHEMALDLVTIGHFVPSDCLLLIGVGAILNKQIMTPSLSDNVSCAGRPTNGESN